MQIKLIGSAPTTLKIGGVAFFPDSVNKVLSLELEAAELINNVWLFTAKLEKNPYHFSDQALNQNLKILNQAEAILKQAEKLVSTSVPQAKKRQPAFYLSLSKCYYLKAKTSYFLQKESAITKDLYLQARQFCNRALNIFHQQKDYKGEILCQEQMAIINDQPESLNYSIISREDKQKEVIEPLNNLCAEIPFKHSSYDSTFETFNHFMGIVFGLCFASLFRRHTKPKADETLINKTKYLFMESGLLGLRIISGYVFTWLFVDYIFVKPVLKLLVKSLGNLPDFLIEPVYQSIKWAFEKEDLMDIFELMGNINHDLMKGSQKMGDTQKADYYKRIANIYFTKYISELDPQDPENKILIQEKKDYSNL